MSSTLSTKFPTPAGTDERTDCDTCKVMYTTTPTTKLDVTRTSLLLAKASLNLVTKGKLVFLKAHGNTKVRTVFTRAATKATNKTLAIYTLIRKNLKLLFLNIFFKGLFLN